MKLLKTILISYFLFFSCSVIGGTMIKESYKLEITSDGINYYVDINNVVVYSEKGKSPVKVTVPINHWVQPNGNHILISVDSRGVEDIDDLLKNSNMNIALVLENASGSHVITQFNLGESKFLEGSIQARLLDSAKGFIQVDEGGDIVVGEWSTEPYKGWLRCRQELRLPTPSYHWSYLNAEFLGDPDSMTDEEFFGLADELWLEYKKIWDLLKQKNEEELLTLFALRSSELDKAFGLPTGSKISEMKRSLESAFNHEDLTLHEMLDNEHSDLRIMANGKIARLHAAGIGEPLIYYSHKRGSFTRFYDMYFMKKDGKWVVIR